MSELAKAVRSDYACAWVMDRRLVRVWAKCGCYETFQAISVNGHWELGDSRVTPHGGGGCQFFTYDASEACAEDFLHVQNELQEVSSGNKGLSIVPKVAPAGPTDTPAPSGEDSAGTKSFDS